MKADKRLFLIIPVIVILHGGFYGGLKDETAGSPEIKALSDEIPHGPKRKNEQSVPGLQGMGYGSYEVINSTVD